MQLFISQVRLIKIYGHERLCIATRYAYLVSMVCVQ